MGVPIDSSIVQNAQTYNVLNSGFIPINLCKAPSEGMRTIGLQFTFPQNWGQKSPPQLVNLAIGATPQISQIAAMFIDCTDSANGVTVVFPDSGYEINCNAGGQVMRPVITGLAVPQFYVVNNGGLNLTPQGLNNLPDTVNIFLFNQFIPSFDFNPIINSSTFSSNGTISVEETAGGGDLIVPLVQASRYIITAIDIDAFNAPQGSSTQATAIFSDDSGNILCTNTTLFSNSNKVMRYENLGLINQGANLTMELITDGTTTGAFDSFNYNIFGRILHL